MEAPRMLTGPSHAKDLIQLDPRTPSAPPMPGSPSLEEIPLKEALNDGKKESRREHDGPPLTEDESTTRPRCQRLMNGSRGQTCYRAPNFALGGDRRVLLLIQFWGAARIGSLLKEKYSLKGSRTPDLLTPGQVLYRLATRLDTTV
ncbi:MAG: hypothetical protein M1816_003529 [Peltula sp. TS41687]|nr:MAG: hypothetical protein M1816_003529 [Peltula sp. TS41687]